MKIGLPSNADSQCNARSRLDFICREKLPVGLVEVIAEHAYSAELLQPAEQKVGRSITGCEAIERASKTCEELIYLIDTVARDLRSELGAVPTSSPAKRVADVVRFAGKIPISTCNGAEIAGDR